MYKAPVIITDFRLFYKQVLPGDDSKLLNTSISVTRKLQLSHNQNAFSFVFTAMSFVNPEKNRYAFKMEGFDKDWNYTNYRNRVATYTNLLPGTYTFRVKASNNDGVWNEEGTAVRITITPPFWMTKVFILVMLSALCFLVFILIWSRTRHLEMQKLTLEKAVDDRTFELKKEKLRAEESEKFKQQFIANMSHEIRTPINAVMGMTELVLDGKLSFKQRRYMEAIRQSSGNLMVILNDILDLSKLEAGKMELEYIPFRLSEQLQFIGETFQLKALEKSLSFTVERDQEIPDVLVGDPTRLMQVLINLVGNAIKFTNGGTVKVICEREDYNTENVKINFRIRDTGIGIPKDRLAAIFDSFTQSSAEISRRYGGTGLGLTISKQLIEKQGGTLVAESTPGAGSEFMFSLCYAIADENMLNNFSQSKLSVNVESLEGISILLAEDNLYNQIVTRDTLGS
jgi:signal transduction histidine kinase